MKSTTARKQPKRLGRPPSGAPTRAVIIGLRATEGQRDRWQQLAEAESRTLLDWMRLTLDRAAEQSR